MKKIFYTISLTMGFGLLLSSCEDDVFSVNLSSILERTLRIEFTPDASTEEMGIVLEDRVRLTDSPEFESNMSRIQEVEVRKVSYQIQNFESANENMILNATLQYIDEKGEPQNLETIANINPSALSSTAEEIELNLNATILEALGKILLEENEMGIKLDGNISNINGESASFEVKVFFDTRVKAGVL